MNAADSHRRDYDDRHELMTVHEVAAALRVSRATVYRMVATGGLHGTRIGRSVRVARRVVEDFLHDGGTDGPR